MLHDYLKTFPQYIIPKKLITHLAGLLAKVKNPRIKNWLIIQFIRSYKVNMQEALQEDPTQYEDFNSFFIRQLKAHCRIKAESMLISPVDGFISEFGDIKKGQMLQAKGHYYHLEEFLGADKSLTDTFMQGSFTTLYLSPKDYHRIHMPIKATLKEMIYIPGKLFSVSPTTARVIPRLFCINRRLVVFFDTSIGLMAMVLVGATIVGAIGTSWKGDIPNSRQVTRNDYNAESITLEQGDEMGYFKLGSTVILLFAEKINWNKNLKAGSPIQFGQALGSIDT